MKIFVFDIDGTICTNTYGEYEKAEPFRERIQLINNLYNQDKRIIMFTARGSTTKKNWRELTEKQLKKWGLKYHELILGKPEGDIFIDDKAIFSEDWFIQNLDLQKDCELEKHRENISKIINSFKSVESCIREIKSNKVLCKSISDAAESIKDTFKNGRKVIFAGNGGSFADAQHISAEFVSKLDKDRAPLPSIALGTNSSNLTAIGNDYGFEKIFSRELEIIGEKGDTIIAITTSGNSPNIIDLISKADEMDINYFILTGEDGGLLKNHRNLIKVPSNITLEIQQIHIIIGHILCSLTQDVFQN